MGGTIRDETAIVGIGQTSLATGAGLPEDELTLACLAISAALDDAGVSPSAVDGLALFDMESKREVEVARNLGLGEITFFAEVGYGGGAACATVGHAAMAVSAGQCEVAVAWRARKRADKRSRVWSQAPKRLDDPDQWTRPAGLLRPVDEIAMLTRRYMHEYGMTRKQLANVALTQRRHANRNPGAAMYAKALDLDQYLSARWISEPLCLYDNCLESDGALAVVVTSAERARDLPRTPVYIHAYAQGLPRQHQTMSSFFCEDPLRGPSFTAARRLWANSDLKPQDVSCAQIYDAFSPLIPLSLEGYGFCERGEGAAFIEDGGLDWDRGRLPVNTSGGSLSEAYVHVFNHVVEGVRQLRGESVCQVADASSCLVTSGECVPTSALLLRR
jgi:acetyl-CoA acetyltransferase